MNIFEVAYQDEEKLAIWGMCPPMPQVVRLLDGTIVTVQPIQPDDAPRLQAFFARLSRDSTYLRFLQHRKELSYQEAVCLATVDYQTQMALVATCEEKAQEDIIAVARYVVTRSDESDWAEPAIVVEDRYQGRGLGVLLLKWLSVCAWSHGIRAFRAIVHPHNVQILRFIEHSYLPVEKKLESGVWDIMIKLEPSFSLPTLGPTWLCSETRSSPAISSASFPASLVRGSTRPWRS